MLQLPGWHTSPFWREKRRRASPNKDGLKCFTSHIQYSAMTNVYKCFIMCPLISQFPPFASRISHGQSSRKQMTNVHLPWTNEFTRLWKVISPNIQNVIRIGSKLFDLHQYTFKKPSIFDCDYSNLYAYQLDFPMIPLGESHVIRRHLSEQVVEQRKEPQGALLVPHRGQVLRAIALTLSSFGHRIL